MKTITLSNDQIEAVRDALKERIAFLESILAEPKGRELMRHLDLARQALDAVQS